MGNSHKANRQTDTGNKYKQQLQAASTDDRDRGNMCIHRYNRDTRAKSGTKKAKSQPIRQSNHASITNPIITSIDNSKTAKTTSQQTIG
jgi:hypothetical protein